MSNTPTTWIAAKERFDQWTLAKHGDPHEQHAAQCHEIEQRFPNYAKFWKYHVCPATERATGSSPGIAMCTNASDIVYAVAQRSHGVLLNIGFALDDLREITEGHLGQRWRTVHCFFKFAGDSLQLFHGLESAVKLLTKELGLETSPFPHDEWKDNWEPTRKQLVAYRNYLSHHGQFYSTEDAVGQVRVLNPEAYRGLKQGNTFTWSDARKAALDNPSQLIPLSLACEEVAKDTINFLNDVYAPLITTLDSILAQPQHWQKYQQLLGWSEATLSVLPTDHLAHAPAIDSLSDPTPKSHWYQALSSHDENAQSQWPPLTYTCSGHFPINRLLPPKTPPNNDSQ